MDELIGNMDDLCIDDDEEEIQLSKELENGNINPAYKEVPYTGQICIFVRWVFTEKYIDGKRNIKARLVARGFEEGHLDQNYSPACSKECLRLMFTLLLSKG